MKKPELLIIEDDPDILELAQYNLQKDGFVVHSAMDGVEGLERARVLLPQLVILDLMLPNMDGLKICQNLRSEAATRNIPILMLTAKSEESDVVVGLELGADDYMTKPFSPRELVARVRAIMRRGRVEPAPVETIIEAGPVRLDTARHEVFHRGQPLALTLAEFKLLSLMASKPGCVFSREQLLDCIGGGDTYLVDRNVDVHIRALRKKLKEDADFIVTIRGVGYKCKD